MTVTTIKPTAKDSTAPATTYTASGTMKAYFQRGYGEPKHVLEVGEAERPVPGEDQVLVRVRASSINAGDWRGVYADPMLVRFMGGLRRPKDPRSVGGDAAGVVEAVGPGTTDLKVGDEVMGIRRGAFSEYVAGQSFVRKPSNLTFNEAAAVPIAGVTALQAIQRHGQLKSGERVLVNGAGGGVGSFAVQIAKALGGEVTAVTRTENMELMRSIGADDVIDYTREDFSKRPEKYDLIVDVGGDRSVGAMRRALAPGGRMIMPGAGRGRLGVLGRIVGGFVRTRLGQPVKFFYAGGPYLEQLATLRDLIEAGKVRPLIDRTYPFGDIPAAIAYVATERARGKVVISISDSAA